MVASDIILFKGMMGSPGEPRKDSFVIQSYVVFTARTQAYQVVTSPLLQID